MKSIKNLSNQQKSDEINQIRWNLSKFDEIHRNSMKSIEIHRNSMKSIEIRWNLLKFQSRPWSSDPACKRRCWEPASELRSTMGLQNSPATTRPDKAGIGFCLGVWSCSAVGWTNVRVRVMFVFVFVFEFGWTNVVFRSMFELNVCSCSVNAVRVQPCFLWIN